MRMCKHILAVADMADMHAHIIGIYLIPIVLVQSPKPNTAKKPAIQFKIDLNEWHMSMKGLGQFKKAFF